MTWFGTHIPLSLWTLAAMLVGAVLSVLAFRALAGWRRWREVPTLLALLLFTSTLALTVTPDGDRPPLGLAACIPLDFPDLIYELTHDGGGIGGLLLNVVLFLPLPTAVVLATRRMAPAVTVSLLPLVIELSQTILPGRTCAVTDLLANLIGVLLGVILGGALQQRWARQGRTPVSRAGGSERRP